MAYRYEKESNGKEALIISGWEEGIAISPHKGIANMQAVNIATESQEVMCSFARFQQSQTAITSGTLSQIDSSHLAQQSGGVPTSAGLLAGTWIVTTGSLTNLGAGTYYVLTSTGTTNSLAGSVSLSTTYKGAAIGSIGAGSVTFVTFKNMGTPIQACQEKYFDSSQVQQTRNYILDTNGFVWVNDTGDTTANGPAWALIDTSVIAPNFNAGGMEVFNGYLHVSVGSIIYVKETVKLGVASAGSAGWDQLAAGQLNTSASSFNSHFSIVSQSNTLNICDSSFVATVQSSSNSGSPVGVPIWSYGTYTFSSTTLTITGIIGGSLPIVNSTITFTSSGTNPLTSNQLYYVKSITVGTGSAIMTIATTIGGSAVSPSGGSGTFYFNTYNPAVSAGTPTYIFSPQALSLPFNQIAQSLCEIGNQIMVGCQTNVLFLWDEFSPLASEEITLPENNVRCMINVNNMAYIFAGYKGNIYISNGSTSSGVISVPDYTAGIAGTPSSYIEPYFTWGGAMYLRGRVYFSIQDQTSSKTGNCGGIWSFIPTQNLFPGQDVGLALRIENKNSYGTYNGMANFLLSVFNQNAIGPQYWSFWTSSTTSPAYGIDFSSTTPSTPAVIETNLIPTGTLFDKETPSQIEYKLSAPLADGESVSMKYRLNATDAFATCGSVVQETLTPISGIFTANFEKSQWIQLQITLSPITSASSSFVRLSEIRVRLNQ